MQKKDHTGIVPDQYTGKKIDTESLITCDNESAAISLFTLAKSRLLNVNHWQQLTGKVFARFQLVDAQGKEVNRPVRQGDYFRVDIPGPGSKSGEGYDWVQVEAVEETAAPGLESIGIRVRPAPNPQNTTPGTSHFYASQGTSNFIVTREGHTVTAAIYDRNLKPNQQAEQTTDTIRNNIVGAGAIAFFSKIQWKQLADGLLQEPG